MIYFLTESAAHLRRLLVNRHAAIGKYRKDVSANGRHEYHLTESVARKPVCVVGSLEADPESCFDFFSLHQLLQEHHALRPSACILNCAQMPSAQTEQNGAADLHAMINAWLRNANFSRVVVFNPPSQQTVRMIGPNAHFISSWTILFKELGQQGMPEVIVTINDADRIIFPSILDFQSPDVTMVHLEKTLLKRRSAWAHAPALPLHQKDVLVACQSIPEEKDLLDAITYFTKHGVKRLRIASLVPPSVELAVPLSRLSVDAWYSTNAASGDSAPGIDLVDVTPLILQAFSHVS